MATDERLARSLTDVKELEAFFRELILAVVKREARPTHGEDISSYAMELGRPIPEALRGEPITWDSRHDFGEFENEGVLVLVGPGHPDALGLTIGCIRWRRFKVCLECGWFYCKIVIKGTF